MYKVVIERQPLKQLARIPQPYNNKIVAALRSLAENPRPPGYIRLKGRPGYRIRVGDYRIIYSIEDNVLIVFVLIIGNRKNVYE